MNVKGLLKTAQRFTAKNSPEILLAIGTAGMITTTILAVKSTPKAVKLLEERKKELNTEKLGVVETVKTAGACYIPTVITGVASVACIFGSQKITRRRSAAMAAAYQISQKVAEEFEDYKDKVKETIGEKKAQVISDAVADDAVQATPVPDYIPGEGPTRCFDHFSGRYFNSDRNKLEKACARVNRVVNLDGYASLNEFYSELDQPCCDIGGEVGWNQECRDILELSYSSHLCSDGVPCLAFRFTKMPESKYARYS